MWWSFLVFVVTLLSACAHYEARPTPAVPSRQALAQAVDGVELAVAPPEDAYSAFEADWRGNGIFPLLLHVENRSEWVISSARRDLVLSTRLGICRQLSIGDVRERVGFSPAGRYFAWSYGLFGIGIVPGAIDHFKAEEANHAMTQDLVSKEMRDLSLTPAEKADGFVFFDCGVGELPTSLQDELTAPGDRKLRFSIPFAGER